MGAARVAPRVLATGLVGTEGPTVLPDGRIAVIHADGVTAVAPDGASTWLGSCGGDPNGLALTADGHLVVANNGMVGRPGRVPGSIQVLRDGVVTTLVDGLDAPNDVVVDSDGVIWFTDPRDFWFDEPLRPGRVHRWDGELTIVQEGLLYPNGLGFDRHGRLLVAESKTGLLHHVDGGATEVWARCPTGAPDGFTFAANGDLFVCCFDVGIIYRFDEGGTVIDEFSTGPDTWPTNCTIGHDGVLYVTESKQGQLLAYDLDLAVD